jgi:NADPH:quinone reductase-like Zn-dependent oxidoreductase
MALGADRTVERDASLVAALEGNQVDVVIDLVAAQSGQNCWKC